MTLFLTGDVLCFFWEEVEVVRATLAFPVAVPQEGGERVGPIAGLNPA